MNVEQIYTGCLAQGAYYIESNGLSAHVSHLLGKEPQAQTTRRSHGHDVCRALAAGAHVFGGHLRGFSLQRVLFGAHVPG